MSSPNTFATISTTLPACKSLPNVRPNSTFIFFLITHGDSNQLITDDTLRKIIAARFKIASIELEKNTAFELMAQAFEIVPAPSLRRLPPEIYRPSCQLKSTHHVSGYL